MTKLDLFYLILESLEEISQGIQKIIGEGEK